MIVFQSNRTSVYENLAAEEMLLDDPGLTEPTVFIYRNSDAVVLGKNQNPWRECAVSVLGRMGVDLARRISGGGTVFHDAGNLNISCLLPRARYSREKVLQMYIDGLRRVGVDAMLIGGTSFAANGKKISGNAFCYRREKVLHHGTLLWKANLEKLRAALVPDLPDVTTRAVASVPMPVINLSDLLPGMSPEELIDTMTSALGEHWGPVSKLSFDPFTHSSFNERVEKLKSWDWKIGATPDFECNVNGAILHIHRGRIIDVHGETGNYLPGQAFSLGQSEQ